MVSKSRLLIDRLRSSMWVLPVFILALMMAAGQGLLILDQHITLDLGIMAGIGVEGARGMLQAVAGSMATVAGVVFSLTLLVLSQASAQYSPRVLRNFLRDRTNQTVLGVFLGVFVYCLVVLRGMGGNNNSIPEMAVIGGLAAAVVSVVYLIYFFHHIARSLQLENILADIEAETLPIIERIYPQDMCVSEETDREKASEQPQLPKHAVAARKAGYIQDIDFHTLLETADRLDAVIHVPQRVGEFMVEGKALAFVASESLPSEDTIEAIRSTFSLGLTRSIQQDPAYGIRQMADVAMKALSPGVNNTSNAIMALDRISVLMRIVAARASPRRERLSRGRLRLVVARPGFESMLGLSCDQIRQWGRNNPAVLGRLLEVLGDLQSVCATPHRRAIVRAYARRVLDNAESHITEPGDLAWIQGRYERCIENRTEPPECI